MKTIIDAVIQTEELAQIIAELKKTNLYYQYGKAVGLAKRAADMLEAVAIAREEAQTHPDDAAVDRFAAAMKSKMAAARAKGRGGWDDQERCRSEQLARMLIDHTSKGDPVDVANFAMMIHQRDALGIENMHIDNTNAGLTVLGFEALHKREEAQTVEPVGVVDEGDDGLFVDLETANGVMVKRGDKLFTHPTPLPSGEREELIERLRKHIDSSMYAPSCEPEATMLKAADMLAADAQRIEKLEETASHWLQKAHEGCNALRRLKWLHTIGAGNPDKDGYEWGVFRVKFYAHGQVAECWQTNSDSSDLDQAMSAGAPETEIPVSQQVAVPQGWAINMLETLIDICNDEKNDPEDRVYVYGALESQLAEISAMLEAAPQPPQAERVPTADMFWNSDDAERLYQGIGEFLNDEICNGSLMVGDVRTVQQAMRLPDVQIRITSIDDDECDAEYEVIQHVEGAKP